MKQKSPFILSICLMISFVFGCKNDESVKFIKVYDGAIYSKKTDSAKRASSTFGTYYAYNYKDSDLKQLMKMLDTLSFDTSYKYHSYRFLKYNSNLPDTTKLNRSRIDGDYSELEDPGASKYYKYQILDFTYMRHHFSEGKYIPDNYSIDFNTYGTNEVDTKYYVRDSLTKKLREVEISTLYPRMKDTF